MWNRLSRQKAVEQTRETEELLRDVRAYIIVMEQVLQAKDAALLEAEKFLFQYGTMTPRKEALRVVIRKALLCKPSESEE